MHVVAFWSDYLRIVMFSFVAAPQHVRRLLRSASRLIPRGMVRKAPDVGADSQSC
jgi:hypothetical protein